MAGSPLPRDRPGALEVICGRVLGEAADAVPLPASCLVSPRQALEQAILPAVQSSPCLVSFSGGRDSSLILAVATNVARLHGLDLPVPITLRFPGQEAAEETAWQRLVLDHLDLPNQAIVEVVDGALEALGPVACEAIHRHGVQWPANFYMHAPLLAQASGGCLLTGFDGDALFAGWRWQELALVSSGRRPPRPADIPAAIYAVLPLAVRRLVTDVRYRPTPWLTDLGARESKATELARWSPEPCRWDRRIEWWSRRRYLALARAALQTVAEDAGARIAHPLLDAAFLAAMANVGGRTGVGGRTKAMTLLASDLLPEKSLARGSKASFGAVVFGRQTRSFASSLSPSDVSSAFVDGEKLVAEWSQEAPVFQSVPLLQQTWLSTQRS